MFDGVSNGMGNLFRLSNAKTRSLSAENPKGEKSGGARWDLDCDNASYAARELGKGWKVRPCVKVPAGETYEIADIDGPGVIQHIWMTPTGNWRFSIIRIYWDGSEEPSVECPVGDFFACGWGEYAQVSSLAVCVNPGSAFNCYWQMPFRKHCRITLENIDINEMVLFYQVDYAELESESVIDDAGYFHASFQRVNPNPYMQDVVILDNVHGKGQYVGTYMCWGVHQNGWWGEGEIKFFMDGDTEYPTICGTGTEDYFCGSYNFENQKTHRYQEFSTPYTGLPQVITPDGLYQSQQRFGLYRWHITDPIRFETDLKVTIQALGWKSDVRYLPLRDDISSVAYWYQDKPAEKIAHVPSKDELEII